MVDAVLAQTVPGPAPRPGPAGAGGGVPAAGRVPVRRAGLLGRSGTGWPPAWTGCRWRGPTRGRADPGAAPARARRRCGRCSTCCAARPRSGGRRGALAGAAGLRDRRHHHDGRRQPRRTWPSTPSSAAAATAAPATRMLRLVALVGCGTRTVIDAVFGPVTSGETTYAPGLLAQPARRDDRCWPTATSPPALLAAQIAATRAEFLIRVRTGHGAPSFPSCAATATAPSCHASAACRSGSSTPRSPSPPPPAAPPAATG